AIAAAAPGLLRVLLFSSFVTCRVQVAMVASRPHTCKMQVTRRRAMSNSISSNATWPTDGSWPLVGQAVVATLAAWLVVVLVLAAGGVFVDPPGAPPLAVAAGAMLPLILFAIAWRTSRALRDFLLALDIHLIAAVQAWRYAGFGFIALYA